MFKKLTDFQKGVKKYKKSKRWKDWIALSPEEKARQIKYHQEELQEIVKDIRFVCSFCQEEHDEYNSMNGIYNGVLVMETNEWDDYNDCSNTIKLPVNFCPICGREVSEDDEMSDLDWDYRAHEDIRE